MADADSDICFCGDRRSDHVDGNGACRLNGLGHGVGTSTAGECHQFQRTDIEFGINPNPRDEKRSTLIVKCSHALRGQCEFPLWTGEAGGVMWHWNGKYRLASITPSIDCQGGCKRHFTITSGTAK